MNTYVTGSTIRLLREAKGLTQAELARQLLVSAKTVSKWETAKGLPDISLLEPLAAALGVSVLELMQGEPVSTGTAPPICCAPSSTSAPSVGMCSTPPVRQWSVAAASLCPHWTSPTPTPPTNTSPTDRGAGRG